MHRVFGTEQLNKNYTTIDCQLYQGQDPVSRRPSNPDPELRSYPLLSPFI